jgi:hypothetical protein
MSAARSGLLCQTESKGRGRVQRVVPSGPVLLRLLLLLVAGILVSTRKPGVRWAVIGVRRGWYERDALQPFWAGTTGGREVDLDAVAQMQPRQGRGVDIGKAISRPGVPADTQVRRQRRHRTDELLRTGTARNERRRHEQDRYSRYARHPAMLPHGQHLAKSRAGSALSGRRDLN